MHEVSVEDGENNLAAENYFKVYIKIKTQQIIPNVKKKKEKFFDTIIKI